MFIEGEGAVADPEVLDAGAGAGDGGTAEIPSADAGDKGGAPPAKEPADAGPGTPAAGDEGGTGDADADAAAAAEAEAGNLEADEQKELEALAKQIADEEGAEDHADIQAQLTDIYKENPNLRSFLKENPDLRYQWFRAASLNKVFPSVREATEAREMAVELSNLDTLYYSRDHKDKETFVDTLWKNNLDGSGKSLGHFEAVQGIMVGQRLADVFDMIRTNPEVGMAYGLNAGQVRYVTVALGKMLGVPGFKEANLSAPATKDGKPALGEPERETEAMRNLREQNEQLKSEKDAFNNKQQETYEIGCREQFTGLLVKDIGGAIAGATALAKNEGIRKMVMEEIRKQTVQAIGEDTLFEKKINRMLLSGDRSPENTNAIIRELKVRARRVMPEVAKTVLRNLGFSMQAAQTQKDERREAAGQRREPSTTGGPGRSTGAPPAPQKRKPGESDADWHARLFHLDE